MRARVVGSGWSRYVTEPVILHRLFKHRLLVRQIALGAQHCLALTPAGVMSWGVGDGGRLGHGDSENRWEPRRIEAFDGMIVIQVAAGAWHSLAIVQIPPHATGGWVSCRARGGAPVGHTPPGGA